MYQVIDGKKISQVIKDELKEKATYITDDFDQNGILKALYHEKIL